jgi:hypothetical protein
MLIHNLVATGSAIVSGSSTITGDLTVLGSISGSIGNAVSASYASTSSFADDFTVAGTLTAQKIVVQTVTSSVVYSSGSNVFGNNISNIQSFTGSVNITGSLNATGIATFDSNVVAANSYNLSTNGTYQWTNSGNRVQMSATNGIWTLSTGILSYNPSITVTSGGNVGIGTTSPAATLHVLSTSFQSSIIATTNATTLYQTYRYNTSTDVGYIGNGTGVVSDGSASDFGFSSLSNMVFGTGGSSSERMRITSTGNVLIGTTITSAKLGIQVANSATNISALDITNAVNASFNVSLRTGVTEITAGGDGNMAFSNSAERMRITSGGNVGIGTVSPEQKLHVEGTIQLGNQENLAWAYDNGQYYNYITNFYDNSTGMAFRAGSWTSGNNVDFSFQTHYGGAWNTKLAIKSDGNVGIGTTSPTSKLEVAGNIVANAGNGEGFKLNGGLAIYRLAGDDLGFYSANTERMRITSGGNVGIGTTSPLAKATVRGGNLGNTVSMSSTVFSVQGNDQGIFMGSFNGTPNFGSWIQAGRELFDIPFNLSINPNGGNVGIGTTSPAVNLQVTNTSGELFRLTNTTGSERLHFYTRNSASNSRIGSQNSSLQLFSEDVGFDLLLGTSNTPRMVITSGGNVLIGTTTDNGVKLQVNGNSSFSNTVNINQGSAIPIVKQQANGNLQGIAHNYRIVRHYPVVGAGSKLIIPFVNQGSLNSNTIITIMGHSARFNISSPLGFQAFIQVGHLNGIASVSLLSSSGNISSISTSGSNLEINFTTAYTDATANGVYVTIEYMTNVPDYSIIVANIAMN